MSNTNLLHRAAFEKQAAIIDRFGISNAYLVWVLSLYLDQSDAISLADESLTDGNNDKKIDFIKVDKDEKRIIIAQGTFSDQWSSRSGGAKSNKASDLNTASAWFVCGDTTLIPIDLREAIIECREAIDEGEAESIDLLYVHNLPESPNVTEELATAARYLQTALAEKGISVTYKEIGVSTVERIFRDQETAIKVLERIEVPFKDKLEMTQGEWKSVLITVNGVWLREIFVNYKDDLFSANYRGFLGTNKRRKINSAIQTTAERSQENFYVYNNGITILTKHIEQRGKKLILEGMSIINGAQTTGSIGSTGTKIDLSNVNVMCRIVECNNSDLISQIVKFNNTQNVIKTWDAYSNDEEQLRIAMEFRKYGYSYSLKRGVSDSQSDFSIETVAQPLIAFIGDHGTANSGRNAVFDSKPSYQRAFHGIKARHILFVIALTRAYDNIRMGLKDHNPTDQISQKIKYCAQSLRFKYFIISTTCHCLDVILGEEIKKDQIAFTPQASDKSITPINNLIAAWAPIVKMIMGQAASKLTEISSTLKDQKAASALQDDIKTGIHTNLQFLPSNSFDQFKSLVSPKG